MDNGEIGVNFTMSKKKNMQKNNISSTNNISTDISKEEIREMIVEAYFEIEKQKEEREKSELIERTNRMTAFENKNRKNIFRFFILLKLYLSKDETDSRFTLLWMSMLLSSFFAFITFMCGVIAVVFGIAIVYTIITIIQNNADIYKNIIPILAYMTILAVSVIFGLLSYCTSKEVAKEKDKNYLTSFFSGIIGFVALIIAFTALVK